MVVLPCPDCLESSRAETKLTHTISFSARERYCTPFDTKEHPPRRNVWMRMSPSRLRTFLYAWIYAAYSCVPEVSKAPGAAALFQTAGRPARRIRLNGNKRVQCAQILEKLRAFVLQVRPALNLLESAGSSSPSRRQAALAAQGTTSFGSTSVGATSAALRARETT